MSCEDNVCGTGSWAGPLPGDPSNNSVLSAVPAFGGIDVFWTRPTTNPYAVAYGLLHRGRSSDQAGANYVATVSSSVYHDKITVTAPTTYYYWIQLVSVNGTPGAWVGPASATAVPLGQQTLESLTGLIDAGVLAQSLKTEISNITVLGQDLRKEIAKRLSDNLALTAALDAVHSETGEALTYIRDEVILRKDSDRVLANSINALAVGIAGNKSALVEEKEVRASADTAIAKTVTLLTTTVKDNNAAVAITTKALADKDTAMAETLTQMSVRVGDNTAAISREALARSTADDAFAITANKLVVASDVAIAAVQNTETTKIGYAVINGSTSAFDGDGITVVYPVARYPSGEFPAYASNRTRIIDKTGVTNWNATAAGIAKPLSWLVGLPLATAVKTVAVTGPDGTLATLETAMVAQKNLNGDFKALYTAKVSVNGLVGGFGIYNDGSTIEAGFDVDRFWVGRTGATNVKPFIVDSGIVYMDKARIRNADIETLKIAGNAVTVPMTDVRTDTVTGNNTYITVAEVTVTLAQPGWVYALFTANQYYGDGLRVSWTRLDLAGVTTEVGGNAVTTNIAVSYTRYLSAGSHVVRVQWSAVDGTVNVGNRNLFVMGVMR